MNAKKFLIAGAFLAGLAVITGAFGAHGLEDWLTKTKRVDTYETAVQFQFYHAMALLVVGILYARYPQRFILQAGWCFLLGTFIFSGSLYILCLTNVGKWGAVTPFGGVFFIIGWLLLCLGIYKTDFSK